jgi:glycosyltransferase involved in cell wall biosynthesis
MEETRMWIIMPVGSSFGWGVCGKYLALELSRLAHVSLITEDLESEANCDPEYHGRLSRVYVPMDLNRSFCLDGEYRFNEPVLQTIRGADLKPWLAAVSAPRMIGYTFFETYSLEKQIVDDARAYYDHVVAGSTWCEKILQTHGLKNCSTIIQGIDLTRFHTGLAEKETFKDRFVIFSGGKLELRKGQDLVMRAFKVLQDKYEDVLLVNSWYNKWDESLMTMRFSPYIRFEMPGRDYMKAVNHLLHVNGIDPKKVITLPPKPHARMAEIYRNTDCGLFPNRCEGGTNLVLMEYMACGKPVIASFSSGHRDVLTDENSLPVRSLKPFILKNRNGEILEQWDDPDLDETIARLEWAYLNRDSIREIGRQAGRSMQEHTWKKAARSFRDLVLG